MIYFLCLFIVSNDFRGSRDREQKKQKQKDRMYFEIFLGFRIQFQYWGILYYFY